jgi:DUF1680 family protein
MEAQLMVSNKLVEETRNQVAVKRGPVVYCLESVDLPGDCGIYDIQIPQSTKFTSRKEKIDNGTVMNLYGNAFQIRNDNWEGQLYRETSQKHEEINIRLVPYYAWGNRGKTDMTVWLPLTR